MKNLIAIILLSTSISSSMANIGAHIGSLQHLSLSARTLRILLQHNRSIKKATQSNKSKKPLSLKWLKPFLAGSAATFMATVIAERKQLKPTKKAHNLIDNALEYIPYPGL